MSAFRTHRQTSLKHITSPPRYAPPLCSLVVIQVPMEPGENWAAHGGVRKLVLRHLEEGVLGTIYLDLHRYGGRWLALPSRRHGGGF